jgi:hypothetical protein
MRRSLADAFAVRRNGPPKAATHAGAVGQSKAATRVLAMLLDGKTLRRIEHETGHRREPSIRVPLGVS